MASKINGLTTIPAEVRDMTRDEAIIIMCESNLQRTKILPSEKAFSYSKKHSQNNYIGIIEKAYNEYVKNFIS